MKYEGQPLNALWESHCTPLRQCVSPGVCQTYFRAFRKHKMSLLAQGPKPHALFNGLKFDDTQTMLA